MSLNTQQLEHIAIAEFLADEDVEVRTGQVLFVVPLYLDGYKPIRLAYAVATAGSAIGIEFSHRGTAIASVSVTNGVLSGEKSVAGAPAISTGSIIRLSVTSVESGTPPKGLTATLTLQKP